MRKIIVITGKVMAMAGFIFMIGVKDGSEHEVAARLAGLAVLAVGCLVGGVFRDEKGK